jgi:hypothetical protein
MPYVAKTAIDLVQQSTVQIVSGKRSGNGCFVARHIILTCAHVLSGPTGQVQILGHGRTLTGKILQRLPSRGGNDYPFPDLAFIGVEQGIDTPSAEIRSLAFKTNQLENLPLQVHGFNRETPAPNAALDVVRLSVVGRSGGYIKAEASGIVKGMSGAPVIDPETGYVCGLLKYFRPDLGHAWFIDGLDVLKAYESCRPVLGRHSPQKPRLIQPEPGSPLHSMFVAQRTVAEELPYQVVDGEVPLSAVYVEQRAEAWRREVARATALSLTAPTEPVVISPYEMLARHRNALIVGGPGSGKSTLLQHLVAESVAWWLRPTPPEKGEEPKFGPAVAIRCPATRLLTPGAWSQSVADAVNADLRGFQNSPLSSRIFEEPPAPGVEWLILVDGLDEVLDGDKRRELIRILATRVGEYGSQARFVVTSRRLVEAEFSQLRSSLVGGGQAERLGEYNIRPFDRPSVEVFAKQWFNLREPAHAAERAGSFLESIDRSRLMPLVAIPLLCTIAADVHQENPQSPLPIGRTGLYERFVDGLLNRRRVHRNARENLIEQLSPLGRSAEEFGEILFDKRVECVTHLAELRLNTDRQPSVALAREWLIAEKVSIPRVIEQHRIREALLSTGLLVNRGDELEFTHQSIAEYLASGPAAERFDESQWLQRVETNGADSSSLFALDRWTSAGHDPMPVVSALAAPGRQAGYPGLSQLAAVLEDGATMAGGAGEAVIDLTVRAVRRIDAKREDSLPAINHATRAILQRADDTVALVALMRGRRSPLTKRIEVAKVLLSDGDATDRRHSLDFLIQLSYRSRVGEDGRLPALRALAEAGGLSERRAAVAHISLLAEAGRSVLVRREAIRVLFALGEIGELLSATIRRSTDPDRAPQERAWDGEIDELEAFVEESEVEEAPVRLHHEGVPPGHVWSVTGQTGSGRRPDMRLDTIIRSWSVVTSLAAALGPEQASSAVSLIMHDRTITWGQRMYAAGTMFGGRHGYLAQVASDVLAGDPQAEPGPAVVHRWFHQRAAGNDAEETLRQVVRGHLASIAEQCCALNLLMLRGDRAAAVDFMVESATDQSLAPPVRMEAAMILGRRPLWYPEARSLLHDIAMDRDVPACWRWAARVAPLCARLDPFTRGLTYGWRFDADLRSLVTAPYRRLRSRLSRGSSVRRGSRIPRRWTRSR